MVTLGWNGYPFSCEEARMWWQVHNVRVASAQGARTGVSCGSTRSKKWHILGKVSLCKNWRNRANNASGRCLRLRTLISSMRWSRSASAESKGVSIFRCVVPNARRSLSFTSSTVERWIMVASISSSTDGSRRKLSHESRCNGVASLLAEEAASGFTKRNLARSHHPAVWLRLSQWE